MNKQYDTVATAAERERVLQILHQQHRLERDKSPMRIPAAKAPSSMPSEFPDDNVPFGKLYLPELREMLKLMDIPVHFYRELTRKQAFILLRTLQSAADGTIGMIRNNPPPRPMAAVRGPSRPNDPKFDAQLEAQLDLGAW